MSGRSANIHNRESASELCPLTRWVVGGGVGSQLDADVSGAPTYTLAVSGEGNLTLSGRVRRPNKYEVGYCRHA